MLYKIYDWGGNLAGYLFPAYSDTEPEDEEAIVELNRIHAQVTEGTLLLPMVKLNLLDNNEGMDIDYVISSLEANTERTNRWKKWLYDNAEPFNIAGSRSEERRVGKGGRTRRATRHANEQKTS